MKTLTTKQNELIKDNLRAYINNFGYIKIEKADCGSGFLCVYGRAESRIRHIYSILLQH